MTAKVFSARELQKSAFARVLIVGPGKVGKTTCTATTAPGPVMIINCDGRDACVGAAAQMTEEQLDSTVIVNARTVTQWDEARALAIKLSKEGKIRSVLVDTVSLLSDTVVTELKITLDGFKLWDEAKNIIYGGVDELAESLQAHLFVICHIDALSGDDAPAGILPMIAGSSKRWIPAAMSDIVFLEAGADGSRKFLLGPQKFWTFQGRNMKRTVAIDADVRLMLKEFGIKE